MHRPVLALRDVRKPSVREQPCDHLLVRQLVHQHHHVGLLATSFIFDIIRMASDSRTLGHVALFTASWFLRRSHPAEPGTGAFVLSLVAVLLAVVTGWLGGELVDRLGVGVDTGAHLDSPSSLSHRSAADQWAPGRLEPRKA